jgi:hypothetical protein
VAPDVETGSCQKRPLILVLAIQHYYGPETTNFGVSETRRFWATMDIARILESGQNKQFPEMMIMIVLEPKLWPSLGVRFVQELFVCLFVFSRLRL